MSDSHITKLALASSLKELMKSIPLSKISIKEIVENCGLNRQTFYYHFKDKFNLVDWIYYTEAIESIADCRSLDNWYEGIYKILEYFINNKSFYINALNTPGQNEFYNYLFTVTNDVIIKVVNEVAEDINVSKADKNFIANFYTHALVGITVSWIKSGMKECPKLIAIRIKDIVDGSLAIALKRYENI